MSVIPETPTVNTARSAMAALAVSIMNAQTFSDTSPASDSTLTLLVAAMLTCGMPPGGLWRHLNQIKYDWPTVRIGAPLQLSGSQTCLAKNDVFALIRHARTHARTRARARACVRAHARSGVYGYEHPCIYLINSTRVKIRIKPRHVSNSS